MRINVRFAIAFVLYGGVRSSDVPTTASRVHELTDDTPACHYRGTNTTDRGAFVLDCCGLGKKVQLSRHLREKFAQEVMIFLPVGMYINRNNDADGCHVLPVLLQDELMA